MKEYKYIINGIKFNVKVGDVADNMVDVTVNGTPYHVELDKAPKQKPALSQSGKTDMGNAKERTTSTPAKAAPASSGSPSAVKSPLPGTIMSFTVSEGQQVNAGDTVCVLEAMKMENDVHSTKSGTVKKILVGVGDAILEGTDIMIIE